MTKITHSGQNPRLSSGGGTRKVVRVVSSMSRTRRIAVAAAVLFGVVALAASGDTDDDSNGGDAGDATENDDVSQGAGSADASGDVSEPQIVREGEGEFGVTYAEVTITNNSSERSDYFVTIVAESPDGATRHDETLVSVIDLDPGQSTTERGPFTSDVPDDAVLKPTEVQRTAST